MQQNKGLQGSAGHALHDTSNLPKLSASLYPQQVAVGCVRELAGLGVSLFLRPCKCLWAACV
eukprot:277447-Amphidinium_carterae.2